jgi:hypothetical protein
MHPSQLWPVLWRRWLVPSGAAAAAVVVVLVVVVVGPSSTSEPAMQAAPKGPVTLVSGARMVDDVQLGFPHTTVGAISAAADLVSEVFSTLNQNQSVAAIRLLADSSYRTAPNLAVQVVQSWRKAVGLAATGRVPTGWTLSFTAAEYQVRHVTADKVMVVLLCEASFIKPGPNDFVLNGVLPFLMHWEHGDWKDAGDTGTQYNSLMANPDSSRAAKFGWKPLQFVPAVPSRTGEPAPVAPAAPPDGPVTLVPGAQVINGVQLGFPHTTVGAISAAASLASEVYTIDAGLAEAAAQLTADSSYPTAASVAAMGAEELRQVVGLAATGPVPAGYSAIFTAVEYQVRDVTADKVMVILLADFTYTEPGPKDYHAMGVYPFLMHWEHGDWKDAGGTGTRYMNLFAQPDSSRAARLGWKPLRPSV